MSPVLSLKYFEKAFLTLELLVTQEFALVEILFEQSFGIEKVAHKRLSRKKTNRVCNRIISSLEKHGFVAKVANLYNVAENTALFCTTSGQWTYLS